MCKYHYRDKTYSIVPCSKEDIPSHIERVLSYWESTGTNIEYQKTLLEACIDAGTAIKIVDENNNFYGCLYRKPINDFEDLVHFIWFRNGLIVALFLDYGYHHTQCMTLRYVPHQRFKISYARFLTRSNILEFYSNSPTINIDIRNYKLLRLHDKYFKSNPKVEEV